MPLRRQFDIYMSTAEADLDEQINIKGSLFLKGFVLSVYEFLRLHIIRKSQDKSIKIQIKSISMENPLQRRTRW